MVRDYRLKKFLIIGILSIISSLWSFLPVCSEDSGFRSKVVHRKITIDTDDIKTLGIKTEKVIEQDLNEIIETTGQIEEIPKNHFDVNSPVQGVIKSVLVDLGDIVKTGEPLIIIKSTEISKLQAEIDQLKAELELAKTNHEREKTLYEKGISPKKDFDAIKAILASGEAKLSAAENNLKILTNLSSGAEQGEFDVLAPKRGTVTERNIAVGQVINQNQILFRGIDLSTVWAHADIYEKDLGKVKLGQKTFIMLDGIPNTKFEGNITYIGSVVNKDTRTLPVKVILGNKDELLKPGAFIQMEIHTGQRKKSIVIPRTALTENDKEETDAGHEHVVYIKDSTKKNLFIPKKIQVESHDSNSVEVISGLTDGEVIVTEGAYQLQYGEKTEETDSLQNKLPIKLLIFIGLIILGIIYIILKVRKSKTS